MLPSMSGQLYQPGWYPDPSGRFEFRFHNGSLWTADVSTNGQRYVDPLGAAPAASQPAFALEPSGTQRPRPRLDDPRHRRRHDRLDAVHRRRRSDLRLPRRCVRRDRPRHRRAPWRRAGRGFAIAGLATGGLAAALCVVGVILSVAVLRAVDRYDNPAANEVTITSCELDGPSPRGRRDHQPRRRRGRLHGADHVRPGRAPTTRIAPRGRSSTTSRPARRPSSR